MDEHRWLTVEEQQAWLELASVLVHLPAALDEQLHRTRGVSHVEYQILSALSQAPDRTMRLSELARAIDASLTKLSRAFDRLGRRGWAARSEDPDDGRYTLGTLTDAGYAEVVAAAPGHVDEVRRLVLEPLTRAQIRQLTEIGRRINRALGHRPS